MKTFLTRELVWESIDAKVSSRLEQVLSSWEGTPYMDGWAKKGRGANCIMLTAAVLDELYRRPEPTKIPRMSPDSGIHSSNALMPVIQAFSRSYLAVRRLAPTVCPGDVLVVRGERTGEDREGHLMIAASRPHTALHAVRGAGVVRTSVHTFTNILSIYRLPEKSTWA